MACIQMQLSAVSKKKAENDCSIKSHILGKCSLLKKLVSALKLGGTMRCYEIIPGIRRKRAFHV